MKHLAKLFLLEETEVSAFHKLYIYALARNEGSHGNQGLSPRHVP